MPEATPTNPTAAVIPQEPIPNRPPPGSHEATPSAWEQAIHAAAESRDAAKRRLADTEKELARYRDAESQRQAQEITRQEQAEKERLERAGQYDQALNAEKARHKAELEASRNLLSARLLPAAIQAAAARIPKLSPEAIADLPALLQGRLQLDYATGDLYAVDEKGHKVKDGDTNNQMPVDKYIVEFISRRPYLLLDQMPRSHGAVGSGSPVKASYEEALASPQLMAEMEKADPEGLKAAQAAYFAPAAIKARARAKHKN